MKILLLIVGALFLNGCAAIVGAGSGLALEPKGPEIVPSSAYQLLNLPPPLTKAVVAVYNFVVKQASVRPSITSPLSVRLSPKAVMTS